MPPARPPPVQTLIMLSRCKPRCHSTSSSRRRLHTIPSSSGPPHHARALHTSIQRHHPAPTSSAAAPAAATSTSAAQPFSTPFTPSPSSSNSSNPSPPTTTTNHNQSPPPPRSTMPAGILLKGLDYLKNADPPRSRPDTEYPSWLWTLLDPPSSSANGSGAPGTNTAGGPGGSDTSEGVGDAFAKSAKQRRLAAKAARALAAAAAGHGPGADERAVPMEEQSVDLPRTGTEAVRAREELKVKMRERGRRRIKEQNFLKGMS